MPQQARLDSPETLHHVMIRGMEGERIFRDKEDRGNFLGRLSQATKRMRTRILAWALMDKHVHLLLISSLLEVSVFFFSSIFFLDSLNPLS